MAFVPLTVSTGYLACWFADLFQFRRRSFLERIFWSIPASIAVSTITAVGLTWLFSLSAAECFFLISGAVWLLVLSEEFIRLRSRRCTWHIGWNPLGASAVLLALVYCVLGILSLIDIHRDHELYMSMTIFDHGSRANWTDGIVRTGVPPANPMFWFKHQSLMRNYYFWYVVCAVVAQMVAVSARCTLIASCVWSGLALSSIIGLYLKHFLRAGERLRRQFLIANLLFAISGLDVVVHAYRILALHLPLFDSAGVWPEINSWYVTLSLAPHHVASLVCCMFAFLLAWMAGKERMRPAIIVLAIGFACSTAFGLSVYVAFAFLLVVIVWSTWQILFDHDRRSALFLMAGGAFGALMDVPYLYSLAKSSSGVHGLAPFGLAVRQTWPPDWLLSNGLFHHFSASHADAVRNLANLLLLPAGLVVELGFFLAAFLVYLVPTFRMRKQLNAESRSLILISTVSLLISSCIKSNVLEYNDFGFRAALFAQFALLLLSSELLAMWNAGECASNSGETPIRLSRAVRYCAHAVTALSLVLGMPSTGYYALMFRFVAPLTEAAHRRATRDQLAGSLSHNAYISYFGFQHLNRSISHEAVVQFNPSYHNEYWTVVALVGINHQTAISSDRPWCGAELGGDPNGCLIMGPPIASLYKQATALTAQQVCSAFGIQYLVATIYDPVWNERDSWVWRLPSVVEDPEFRALDCREPSQSRLRLPRIEPDQLHRAQIE